jgi:ABC-type multidrug transport system fused ATPase/permease subunit
VLENFALLLSVKQRWRALRHASVILAFAVVEVAWIGMIYELVTLSTLLLGGAGSGAAPIADRVHIAAFQEVLGIREPRPLLIAIAIAVMAVVVLRSLFGLFVTWQRSDFVKRLEVELMSTLLGSYLSQDYVFHLRTNSSTLAKNILSEASQLVSGMVMATLTIVTDAIVAIAILAFLFVKEPMTTLVVLSAIAVSLGLVYSLSRRQLSALGERSRIAEQGRYRIVQEALAGIKDIKVHGRERHFLGLFRDFSSGVASVMVQATMLKESPRYAVETTAFLLLVGVIIALIGSGAEAAEISGALALFGISGFRLMPIAFRVYKGFGDLRYSQAIIESTCRDVALAKSLPVDSAEVLDPPLFDEIRFERVEYRYPEALETAVRELDLTLRRNTSVALVGATGAGKSTIADLLLGLIEPTGGRIVIGDEPFLGETARRFRRRIGYVAQHIFLMDDTVRSNIAFGIAEADIDDERVERAARAAHLHDFVVGDLPAGYRTEIGERGVRLSGGQRQRIGIARALYHDPDLLIFDEATSALDGVTESIVTEALKDFSGAKTMLIIAHRLTTIRHCDRIYVIERGRIAAQGTYDELMAGNATFRAMAGAAASAH